MFRQALARFGMPVLVAAVFSMAEPAWAQHHGGGGHGGGFHGGGFHGGGFHQGGFHPGSFHHDGFHHGFFFPGYFYGYDPGNYYGNYPADSYYLGNYYGNYPAYDLGSGSASDLGYSDSYGGIAPAYRGGYPSLQPPSTVSSDPASVQADATVHVTVKVPANAELWVEGAKTTSTGSVRELQSPPLAPGQYTYEIRADWTANGRDITQTQKVAVSPGAHIAVDFPIGSERTQTQGVMKPI